jgi:hypothetical protein
MQSEWSKPDNLTWTRLALGNANISECSAKKSASITRIFTTDGKMLHLKDDSFPGHWLTQSQGYGGHLRLH